MKQKNILLYVIIAILVFLFVLAFVFTKNTYSLNNDSKIHFMATGESNSFLIESNGHYALIDASNPFNEDYQLRVMF